MRIKMNSGIFFIKLLICISFICVFECFNKCMISYRKDLLWYSENCFNYSIDRSLAEGSSESKETKVKDIPNIELLKSLNINYEEYEKMKEIVGSFMDNNNLNIANEVLKNIHSFTNIENIFSLINDSSKSPVLKTFLKEFGSIFPHMLNNVPKLLFDLCQRNPLHIILGLTVILAAIYVFENFKNFEC
ncbi:hypothetical protein PFNF135_00127 [Plasmodium falciparum NF135/5.C10]|uniref:Uncharacterized protein n=1 Tax=Plasmodium falciparum NF135/5.C10 TaxID=1036726 RepID=W4IQD7_PLAFA|nr:hypothetical protein PFNF135_00127 [Plasmodium falciparum NF135/5.C10]